MATAAAVATTDKKAILRDKRAQGIAAMGLVTRSGDRFQVQTPSLRGRRASYEVWRDETGKIRCSCLEFEEGAATDAAYRCEHILAVKHSLTARNTEAVTKQPTAQKPAISLKAAANKTANIEVAPEANNEIASEKLVDENATNFGREQNETEEAAIETKPLADVSNIRSLANTRHEEDINMKKQFTNAPVAEPETKDFGYDGNNSDTENVTSIDDATAPVVPLAFTNTLRTLRQPVDPKLVKTREGWTDRQGNKHMVEYVEWHTVADILDRVHPTWSHAVKNIAQIGDMVAVTAAITIDNVTREGVGTGTADNETGIKKAEHDALKRAAIKFGIARDLYQRETEVIEREGSAPQGAGEFPRDPLAKSMSDLVTPKQLGMIRALAREANVDVEAECQTALRCRTDELSKRGASSFIDHLKNLGHEAAAATNGGMRRAS